MKKLILALLLAFSVCFCFAETKAKKLLSAGVGEVVMVGKINVHIVDEKAFEFYAKSWGVKDLTQPDCYITFDYSYTEYYRTNFLGQLKKSTNSAFHNYSPDDYFLIKGKVKKDEVENVAPVKWCFYSDEDFQVYLPLRFKTHIPKGEKYVYVGNFDYYLDGSDFSPVKIVLSDHYDEAKDYLQATYGTDANLCRVEIRNIEE